MGNCLGCRTFVATKPNNGSGECWYGRMSRFEKGKWIAGDYSLPAAPVKDALKESCKNWVLLCMGQVASRSARKFVWDGDNVRLR